MGYLLYEYFVVTIILHTYVSEYHLLCCHLKTFRLFILRLGTNVNFNSGGDDYKNTQEVVLVIDFTVINFLEANA